MWVERKMAKYKAKSIIISRKPGKKGADFYTAIIAIFDENNGHLTGKPPRQAVEFENTEKVMIKGLDVDFYTEGNDIVINNLTQIAVEKKGSSLIITK